MKYHQRQRTEFHAQWVGFARNRFAPALLILCMLLSTAAHADEAPQLLEPVGVKVDTALAYIGEISQISVYNASVTPYVEELYFSLDGRVGEVHVVVGQTVSKGDPLITLDQKAQVERAKTLRQSILDAEIIGGYADSLAQIDLEILSVELNRLMSAASIDENAVALKKNDIEQAQLQFSLARELREMELTRLRAELAAIEADLEQNVLYAPFDGHVVYGVQLEKGNYISAYNPLIYLADDSKLSLTSDYISPMYAGSANELYALIGGGQYPITHVPIDQAEYISMVLSGATLTSEFTIDTPDDTIEPGMYAAICLVSKRIPDALLIPSNAIFHDAAGKYVYVVEGEERFRRPIKTGIATDWLTQIVEGLEEGEVVYVKD